MTGVQACALPISSGEQAHEARAKRATALQQILDLCEGDEQGGPVERGDGRGALVDATARWAAFFAVLATGAVLGGMALLWREEAQPMPAEAVEAAAQDIGLSRTTPADVDAEASEASDWPMVLAVAALLLPPLLLRVCAVRRAAQLGLLVGAALLLATSAFAEQLPSPACHFEFPLGCVPSNAATGSCGVEFFTADALVQCAGVAVAK